MATQPLVEGPTIGSVRPGPNLNPSPKNRFRESAQNISDHRAMVESRTFQRACDYALMEYQWILGMQVLEMPQNSAFVGLKLAGAMDFLNTLKTLSEQSVLMRRPPTPNLDHTA